MIFRRYFLIVLLTFPFVASAQLFRPLNLGFNGGERQGTWECLTEFVYGNPAATAIGFHPARSNIIYNSGEGLIYEGHIKISCDSGQTWNDNGQTSSSFISKSSSGLVFRLMIMVSSNVSEGFRR